MHWMGALCDKIQGRVLLSLKSYGTLTSRAEARSWEQRVVRNNPHPWPAGYPRIRQHCCARSCMKEYVNMCCCKFQTPPGTDWPAYYKGLSIPGLTTGGTSSSPVFPDSVYFRDFFRLWEQMSVQQEHPA